MTVGEKIKNRRIELNMSQDELAKKVGYKSRSSINKIEMARDLPMKKTRQMATALELPLSYLLGWDELDALCEPPEVVVVDQDIGITEAMKKLYDKYIKASPEIRQAIDLMLRNEERKVGNDE